jgi:hypothetical protein
MAYRAMSLLGFFDRAGELIGVARSVADFIRRTSGTSAVHRRLGAARQRRRARRSIARSSAGWSRMARAGCAWVVQGNVRRALWLRCGYVQVRERGPMTMGRKSHLLRVMAKPLAGGGTIAE